MVFELSEAKAEFERIGQEYLGRLQKEYAIKIAKSKEKEKTNKGLSAILKHRADLISQNLIYLSKIWGQSNYTQIGNLTFENWLKKSHPDIYRLNFDSSFTEKPRYCP
jgi:hypothetical protein